MTAADTAPEPSRDLASQDRIAGYDLARSWAILGMLVLHLAPAVTVARSADEPWDVSVLRRADGRPTALFIVRLRSASA
jgi:hypothetical protein